MTRTVIGLLHEEGRVKVTLDRSPLTYTFDTVDLDLDQVQSAAQLALDERGSRLATLLRTKDPVKAGLDALLSHQVGSPPAPLYFHVRSPTADAIPWETLYAPPIGFLALDQRCPVGRIAERVTTVRGRQFAPPLRVVAVLSAAGRDPRPQLEALQDAAANAGFPVELTVISGDTDLVDDLQTAGVKAEYIAANAIDLCRQIAAARPQVLHLLCHGRTRSGIPTLAFSSIADVESDRDDLGSINVAASQLVQALLETDPWLVVLAACETASGAGGAGAVPDAAGAGGAGEVPDAAGAGGAGAVPDAAGAGRAMGRPLAHELVHSGLTAVIGMRRLVDLADTDRFCGVLYPQVFATVRAALEGEAGERVIDWAGVLTGPRQVMGGDDPSLRDAWTDPVLYVQSEDLRVRTDGAGRLQGKLEQYRNALAYQESISGEPGAIAVLRQIVADLEAELAASAGG